MRLSSWLALVLVAVLLPSLTLANPGKTRITLIVWAGDSIMVAQAFKELEKLFHLSHRYDFKFYTDREIKNHLVKGDDLNDSDIILADFMHHEIVDFVTENLKNKKIKLYSLRCAQQADKLKRQGFQPDSRTEPYYSTPTAANLRNLLLMVLSHRGERVSYEPPFILPAAGIFHPEGPKIFSTFPDFLTWYQQAGKYKPNSFWVGLHTFHVAALQDRGKIEAQIIQALEREGINALPVYGPPPHHNSLKQFFLDERGQPRVQIICGFSFRFLSGFREETEGVLQQIDAPIIMPLTVFAQTIDQWQRSDRGISPLCTAWQVCTPELNGAIEPSIVGGKEAASLKGVTQAVYDTVPLPGYIDFVVRRIKAWHALQVKPNRDKKIAILYWNHPPGKQNVGASYLNIFRSLAHILSSLKSNDYRVEGRLPTEEEIKHRILLSGRNVGSWAPGELAKLISAGEVIRIPISKYKEWFKELDPEFQREVIRQWGPPEEGRLMIKNREIIIPQMALGNIILAPQPTRGISDDPNKMYHDRRLYPHHQYIAFYLWLKKEFKADAIISLGKHGTHEWLPGKEIGLSQSCAPEVLIQDIPNIYPYIVDNVGEGIQAKRRGRGVIIDHLIPPLKKGGSYMEYRRLTSLIDEYHNAQTRDAPLAAEKLKRAQKLIRKLGLGRDLRLTELNDEAIEKVEHYILELQERLIPYGLHTYGVSPQGDSLHDLAEAICVASPEIKTEEMKARLEECGPREMASLLRALQGKYIPPGQGNDPVRTPAAVPTGRNFHGLDLNKVPSREAFALGKKLADDMIKGYREKHGAYPDKLGIILWATETQKNEGVNESAALHLLGITPVWDKKNRVVDLKPIPGSILKRPRIDVLLQASGLYRDTFSQVIKWLDRAVRLAGSLRDVENFVALHSARIAQALQKKGYSPAEARELSQARVFSDKPGAYGNAVQDLIPDSGTWQDDREIADVWIHQAAFAYGDKLWGKPLQSAYKYNLKDIKITMHSRSSNLVYMLDNDDMYGVLGGLSLAVKSQAGKYPEVLVANNQKAQEVTLDDLNKSIGKALRTRYLNPKWIEGMKKEGYAGARLMDKFVEHLWGFQVTTPFAVDKTCWEQIHEVYLTDKYHQGLKDFFDRNNPWALQSISARMLEADRKGYWQAPPEMKKNLAKTYALSVIEKGLACSEHVCNNPKLQRVVTDIISRHGLLTPQQLDRFKAVMAKATGKTQKEQEAEHNKTREGLTRTIQEIQKDEDILAKGERKKIEGFEMVEQKPQETNLTASGSPWAVLAMVLGLLALFFSGWQWKRQKI